MGENTDTPERREEDAQLVLRVLRARPDESAPTVELLNLLARLRAAEARAERLASEKAVALYEALSVLYFADSADYGRGCMAVVRVLAPEIAERCGWEDDATFKAVQEAANRSRALADRGDDA